MNLFNWLKILAFTVIWFLVSSFGYPQSVSFPLTEVSSSLLAQQSRRRPDFGGDSSIKGRPVKRKDPGSSAPLCEVKNPEELLTALVPKLDIHGLTVESHPTFWFYIPFSTDEFNSLQFELRNADGKKVYESTIDKPDSLPGVIGISLPSTEAPLEMDQQYKFFFSINCKNPQSSSDSSPDFYVYGSIKRIVIDSELSSQLKTATSPQEQAIVYAGKGIWFEALTSLGNSLCSTSNNPEIVEDWKYLLEQVELGDVASKPIISCP